MRLATLVVWVLAAGSLAYWGLRLAPRTTAPPIPAAMRTPMAADPVAVARLLGASPAAGSVSGPVPVNSLASRFNLLGVVASRSQRGAALIAVDGKPARPFRVGTAVDGLVLQAVQGRRAILAASADGPAVLTLELPPLER